MILLSDSGSTKTDWCVVSDGQLLHRFTTKGINPFYQTEEEIACEVEECLIPNLKEIPVSAVYFYGAGCAFPDKNEIVRRAINRYLSVPVEVGSDLLAAARALCGNQPGIACILGTGSNSCQYDGQTIIRQISPLGFILGDEGSGAVLGKLLVGDLLKDQLPQTLKEEFFREYNLTPAQIMEQVYRQPFPNRFLAGLSPFLLQHITEPTVYRLVSESFRSFFIRNVKQYEFQHLPIHITGSVAYHYREIIQEVMIALGLHPGRLEQSPMSGLIAYHS